jgi:hypothetical protein
LRVVGEQFLVLGAEDQVPLLRVQVAGNEVFGAERGKGGVEFVGGGFVEGRDAFGSVVSIEYALPL